MKNKSVIFVCLLFVSVAVIGQSTSQNVKATWGEIKKSKGHKSPEIIARIGTNIYTSNGNMMYKFSIKNLSCTGEYPLKDIEKEISKKGYKNDLQFFGMKNKLFCILMKEVKDGKNSAVEFALQQLGENCELIGEPVTLGAKPGQMGGTFSGGVGLWVKEDKSAYFRLWMKISPDSSKMVFAHTEKDVCELKTFDTNLKEIEKTNFKFTADVANDNSVKDVMISDDGMVYLYLINAAKANRYYPLPKKVVNVNMSSGEKKDLDISIEGKYIKDCSFSFKDGNKLLAAGLYGDPETDKKSKGDIKGLYYILINKTGDAIEAKGTIDFSGADASAITEFKKLSKEKPGMNADQNIIEIRNIIAEGNGNTVVVSEISYDHEAGERVNNMSQAPPGQNLQAVYKYLRANIIAMSIASDSKVAWYANIPKNQLNEKDAFETYSYASIMTFGSKDRIYILYNDPKEQVEDEIELDYSGKFTQNHLFKNDTRQSISPTRFLKISDTEVVCLAYWPHGWEIKLGKLTFK